MLRNIGFLLVLSACLTTFFACNEEEKQAEKDVNVILNEENANSTETEADLNKDNPNLDETGSKETESPATNSLPAKIVYYNLSTN